MNGQTQTQPEPARRAWAQTVVAHLQRLAKDRGALAELRRGLSKEPHRVVAAARRHVLHLIPDNASRHVQNALMTVAPLFASHPESGTRDLGAALRALDPKHENGSVERRFIAILNADAEDLPTHLRHAISLLKSKGVSLDWAQLLQDCMDLGSDHEWAVQRVHRRWAQSFWASRPTRAEDAETAETSQPAPNNDTIES